MLSNEFNRPLRLQRKASNLLAVYLLLVHILAIFSVLLANIELLPTLLCILLLTVSAVYHAFYYWPSTFDDMTGWVWQKDAVWIETNPQHDKYWQLQANPVVTPWFVIVPLRDKEGRRRKMSVVFDQIDTDAFRRLRVRLKFYSGRCDTHG